MAAILAGRKHSIIWPASMYSKCIITGGSNLYKIVLKYKYLDSYCVKTARDNSDYIWHQPYESQSILCLAETLTHIYLHLQ